MKKGILVSIAVIALFLIAGVSYLKINKRVTRDPVHIDLTAFKHGEDIFITPQNLKEQLGDKNLVILDGNHPKLYAKGHIPGAINIGFKGLSRAEGKPGDPLWGTILPIEELTKKLESFGITNNSLVVAYSDTLKGPGAGGRAVWQLRMAGLTNVKLLWGGMAMWESFSYPTTKELPKLTPSTNLVLNTYDESYRTNLEEIIANIDTIKLLDTRTADEFTGSDNSRGEARAGHIKNSKWLAWTDILDSEGAPKTPTEITATLAGLGIKPEDDFTVY